MWTQFIICNSLAWAEMRHIVCVSATFLYPTHAVSRNFAVAISLLEVSFFGHCHVASHSGCLNFLFLCRLSTEFLNLTHINQISYKGANWL